MKTKKMLLSSLLALGIVGVMSANIANAADNASQTITATLPTCQKVETDGGNLTTTIDCDTGALAAALTPAFLVTTNTATTQKMFCNATAPITGAGSETAMGLQGGTMYLAMANTAVGFEPTAAQVQDAIGAGPTVASNPNVIAFTTDLTSPQEGSGVTINELSGTTTDGYDIDLARQGESNFTSSTSGTARAGTYDFLDTPGSYQSTILLSFGTLP